ncbi:MAG: hypothetical protein ACK5FU_05645 [Bacteroidota bacterium]|jgi:hypothetical protein|nr:hypothetical protein [Sphingobacteriales bacterium]
MAEKITLLTKRKSIQLAFDYCMDHKIPFAVSPRGISPDEFEIDLTISEIKQAVALGMFAKDAKFEVFGLGEMAKLKTPTNGSKKAEVKLNGNAVDLVNAEPSANALLNF